MQWYRLFDSYMDILIIAVVALIIFGGTKKIPEMARNLGKASGEFKRGQMEIENELRNGTKATQNTKLDIPMVTWAPTPISNLVNILKRIGAMKYMPTKAPAKKQ